MKTTCTDNRDEMDDEAPSVCFCNTRTEEKVENVEDMEDNSGQDVNMKVQINVNINMNINMNIIVDKHMNKCMTYDNTNMKISMNII